MLQALVAQPPRRRSSDVVEETFTGFAVTALAPWSGMQHRFTGNLHAQQVALDAVVLLRPVVLRIHRHDKSLADQTRRAASSVVLNLAEAAYNNQGHRRSRLESARGSANEVRAALSVARAWGYIDSEHAAQVDALYDRVLAMTYRLWARA